MQIQPIPPQPQFNGVPQKCGLAKKIANFINGSKGTQKVLRNISDNPALYGTISAFAVGTTIRPALTMGVSTNKKDGIYSSASSMASSLVELIGGFTLFTPMRKCIDESSKELFHSKNTVYYENKFMLRNYKSIANRIYKCFTFPITSSIRFAMVPIIASGLNNLGLNKSGVNKSENR